ncbi:MAG: DNA replication/repair protein RecF [Rhodobacter sp.]|nr:DNA replication/repair protein RecF [Rhodobacter sp.]MCY4242867.1 DNA replication/repair protein RecF [Rhodobacter sp.]
MTGLAVTGLSLSRFRNHRTLRLDLDGRPIALFGPNGAGKTNLLEAVSLLSPGRGLRRAATDEVALRPERSGWKVSAIVRTPCRTHEVVTWAQIGGTRQVTVDGKAAPQVELGRIVRIIWLVPSMDRLWMEGAEHRRRFLDRIALSFDPEHAEHALIYNRSLRERNRLLKDQVRDRHWYGALESRMAAAGCAIQAGRRVALHRLADAQAAAETAFPAAELLLTGAEGSLTPDTGDGFASALAESRQRDLYAGRTLVGPHRADLEVTYAAKGIPARQCSTGEQKALLISVVLSNARALIRNSGIPPILLLDEIAAHLDSGRRAALYDEICALGAQAWMTGTGSGLFDGLASRARHLEISDTGGVPMISESGS